MICLWYFSLTQHPKVQVATNVNITVLKKTTTILIFSKDFKTCFERINCHHQPETRKCHGHSRIAARLLQYIYLLNIKTSTKHKANTTFDRSSWTLKCYLNKHPRTKAHFTDVVTWFHVYEMSLGMRLLNMLYWHSRPQSPTFFLAGGASAR